MTTKHNQKIDSVPVYRRVRFPGITQFARAHGYNYASVYRHLTGERPSKTIDRKWAAWNGQNSKAV